MSQQSQIPSMNPLQSMSLKRNIKNAFSRALIQMFQKSSLGASITKQYGISIKLTKIQRNDPELKKIYSDILEHDNTLMKVKADRLKFGRPQILKYLKKRYIPRHAEIICQQLNFPVKGTFEDYCQTLDNFIKQDARTKRQLGFLLHDQNNDARIDLTDIFDSIRNLTSSEQWLEQLSAKQNHGQDELSKME